MTVSIVDAIIILMILRGAIVGFKHGAIKEGTKFLGFFIVVIVSFILKDKLMILMYENLPFFDFFGLIKGIDAINVLFYQLISFLIVFAALLFVLKIVLVVTGLIEWLLKATVILSIPSKILGLVVGAVEYYVYIFIALYVLNMPVFGLNLINDSKVGNFILDKTPVLSNLIGNTIEVYSDVWDVIRNRGDLSNREINTFVLATLLDNRLITIDSARELVNSNYISIEDPSILDNYSEGESFFEQIGGCLLLGGCDGDSSYIDDIYSTTITDTTGYIEVEDIKFKVVSITDDISCVKDKNCKSDEEVIISFVIDNGYNEINMTVSTNDGYRWIVDTMKYVYAKIEDGKLVVGISKYSIK